MTLTAAQDQIAADIVALTPPDRTEIPYARISDVGSLDGRESQGRMFAFAAPAGREVILANDTSSLVLWTVDLLVAVDSTGRNASQAQEAVIDETQLIAAAIETRASWPSGVLSVRIENSSTAERDGVDPLIVLSLEIESWES